MSEVQGNSVPRSTGETASQGSLDQALAEQFRPVLVMMPEISSEHDTEGDFHPLDIRMVLQGIDDIHLDYVNWLEGLVPLARAKANLLVAASVFVVAFWLVAELDSHWSRFSMVSDMSWYSPFVYAVLMLGVSVFATMALPAASFRLCLAGVITTFIAFLTACGLSGYDAIVADWHLTLNPFFLVIPLDFVDEAVVALGLGFVAVELSHAMFVRLFSLADLSGTSSSFNFPRAAVRKLIRRPTTVESLMRTLETFEEVRQGQREKKFGLPSDKDSRYLYFGYQGLNVSDDVEKHRRAYLRLRRNYDVTAYAHVTRPGHGPEGLVVIQYWLAYFYNDWANKHQMDWEQVTVLVRMYGPRPESAKIVAAGFSAHHGGSVLGHGALDYHIDSDDRVAFVCYVAKGSHANYPKPGWLRPSLPFAGLEFSRRDLAVLGAGRDELDVSPYLNEATLVEMDAEQVVLLPNHGRDRVFGHACEGSHDVDTNGICRFDFRWLNMRGIWGAPGKRGGDMAPKSPIDRPAWEDPMQWLEDCYNFEEPRGTSTIRESLRQLELDEVEQRDGGVGTMQDEEPPPPSEMPAL